MKYIDAINSREFIYNMLVLNYMNFYKGHFIDKYDGQNKLRRMANIHAVENTNILFEEMKNESQ